MEAKLKKLLDRAECLTLLTTQSCNYWSVIKFAFSIPLVLTSSAMCIINSISQDANQMKIPNIIVNAVSVLIVSLNNNIKASEKTENYKRLSQQFMNLSQEIESYDAENAITKDKFDLLILKYDNLVNDVSFEDIPNRIMVRCAKSFSSNNRHIPVQLNGCSGNNELQPFKPIIL